MKAITLHQPWASLIACGAKPYETRSFPPPAGLIGRRIAIHAAARKVCLDELSADLLRAALPLLPAAPAGAQIERIDPPAPAKGRQGWWHWPPANAVRTETPGP